MYSLADSPGAVLWRKEGELGSWHGLRCRPCVLYTCNHKAHLSCVDSYVALNCYSEVDDRVQSSFPCPLCRCPINTMLPDIKNASGEKILNFREEISKYKPNVGSASLFVYLFFVLLIVCFVLR